jgi:hypothetical protein
MKFSSFPRFSVLSLLAGVFALALAGCGGTSNLALTQGNWSVTAISSGSVGTFYIGGNLTQNKSTLSGMMLVVGSCIDPSQSVAFTGTVDGKNVTLASASSSGQVITITASGTTNSALTGTYTVTGGCDGGDSGSVTASAVPSISATWSGPIASQGGSNVTLAIAFTQAVTPSSDGTFALTGNATFTNSSCSSTGTVNTAFIAGPYLFARGLTDDGGNFSYSNVLLNNPASPTSMKGDYEVSGGNCDGDLDTPTFTKQ